MTLNACQKLVQSTLNGITSAYTGAATCYITPHDPDEMAPNPLIYVWGAHGSETRRAGPRGIGAAGGFKRVEHTIRIWINLAVAIDSPNIDALFPVLMEAIKRSLRQVTMPQPLTDPDDGTVSQLVSVGEKFEWDYDTVRALEEEAMIALTALIVATLIEDQQA